MAKKVTPVKSEDLPESPVKDAEAEIQSYEIKPAKTVETISKEGFEGKKLHMLADGLYRYSCFEVNAIPKDFFGCAAAKNYGLRKGDIVHLYDNDSVKTVVVKG